MGGPPTSSWELLTAHQGGGLTVAARSLTRFTSCILHLLGDPRVVGSGF